MVLAPGFQFAGHTSPCSSTYWKAFTSLRVSSGFLPTGKSLMDECLRIPDLSMMNVPRKDMAPSGVRTP